MVGDFKRGYDCLKRGSYSEALHYFRVAVSDYGYSFDLNAAAYVGYCHDKGYGTPQDLYTAMQWYRLAVERGGQKWEQSWVGERLRALERLNLQPKVSYPVTIDDCRIGRIINMPDDEPIPARFRVKEGVIYVCGSLKKPYDYVVWQTMSFIKERAEKREMSIPDVIDENCYADYDCFKVRIKRGTGSAYSHSVDGFCYTVITPHDVKFEHLAVRETLVNYIRRLMKDAAKRYLPSRLESLSEKTGLKYSRCEVKSLSGIWGRFFCHNKAVELNTQLILQDVTTIDAVIVHELCHQKASGHGQKFHDAMLQYGGRELYNADVRIKSVNFKIEVK